MAQLRSASEPNLGRSGASEPNLGRSGTPSAALRPPRALSPLGSPGRASPRRPGSPSRYINQPAGLRQTDHSLEDVSFSFPPRELAEEFSLGETVPLDVLEVASKTMVASIPPNKRAPFGEASMSGITAIQNRRSDVYLRELRKIRTSAGPALPKRSRKADRRTRNLNSTTRAFDEVLGLLSGEPVAAPEPAQSAPKEKKKAAAAPTQQAAATDEEQVFAKRGAAAIRERLETTLDDLRWSDVEFKMLGARVRKSKLDYEAKAAASRRGSGRDCLAMNLRLLSPQKRLQAIHTMAAVERQRVHQAQQKKAVLDEEMRQRAEIHANRREVKKAREAAERRAAALAVRQRQLLTSVAVAARVKHLAKVVTTYREISGEEKEQTAAANVIQRCFRIFKWQKENAHIRQERNDAARRVQRRVRNMLFRRRLRLRKLAAEKIAHLLESVGKSAAFPLLVKGYLFKVKQIQRRWRSFKTLQNAQVTVIRAWLTNYRRKSIDKRKELEAALKEHKDKKPKAKAGKKVQVDSVRIELEEGLAELPKFDAKPPNELVLGETVLEWLKRRLRTFLRNRKEYARLKKEYDDEMAQLESILAARRAMGAANRENMPVEPVDPVFLLFPSPEEAAVLLKDAEAKSKRVKKKR